MSPSTRTHSPANTHSSAKHACVYGVWGADFREVSAEVSSFEKPRLGGKPPPRHPRSVKMVAYGSDGASVFKGKHNGAVVRLR